MQAPTSEQGKIQVNAEEKHKRYRSMSNLQEEPTNQTKRARQGTSIEGVR